MEYHILLGGILKKIGMHDEAGLIYSNALRLSPENLEVFLEASENFQTDERFEEALQLLDAGPSRLLCGPTGHLPPVHFHVFLGQDQTSLPNTG